MLSPLTITFTMIKATIVEADGKQSGQRYRWLMNEHLQRHELGCEMDEPEY